MNLSEVLAPTLGGVLIGLAAIVLLLFTGRVAGVSGILGSALSAPRGSGWRWAFVAGLVAGGAVYLAVSPENFVSTWNPGAPLVAVAGLLVGFGTRLGSGCTSGHGICGVSRLSPRSLVATGTFMLTGMAAAYIMTHFVVAGGPS